MALVKISELIVAGEEILDVVKEEAEMDEFVRECTKLSKMEISDSDDSESIVSEEEVKI